MAQFVGCITNINGFDVGIAPPMLLLALTLSPSLHASLGKDRVMPTLKEDYECAVKPHGEDSSVAKAIKRQMENEKAIRGRSFQELFETEFGPKLQELKRS